MHGLSRLAGFNAGFMSYGRLLAFIDILAISSSTLHKFFTCFEDCSFVLHMSMQFINVSLAFCNIFFLCGIVTDSYNNPIPDEIVF